MTESIIVALVSGGLTLIGVLVANSKTQAVINAKIEKTASYIHEHKYWVYCHTFPNGKVYIGITMQYPSKRWHRGKGYSYNRFLYRAIEKYGWNNVKHEIVAYGLTKEEACAMEIALIREHKSNDVRYGYNLSSGGEHGGTGVLVSDGTRLKRSLSMRGKNQGLHLGSKSAKARAVRQYTRSGEFVAEYGATTDAQRATGIHYSGIAKCCSARQNTAGGYIWVYSGDEGSLPHRVDVCGRGRHRSLDVRQKTSLSMKQYWARKRGAE